MTRSISVYARLVLATAVLAATLGVSFGVAAEDASPKEIRIVTEGGFVPWNYTKPDGTLAGFEIDLANDLCNRMKVKCTISAQSFDSMISALNAGKFDAIIDDMAITPKRELVIDFSVPYATLCYTFGTLKGGELATNLPAEDKKVSLMDEAASAKALAEVKGALSGKTVGTLSSGTSAEFASTYLKGISVRQYKSPEARDLDMLAGRVDAVIGAKDSLLGTAAKPGNEGMVLAGPCFFGGVVGKGAAVGLRKGDTQLKAMFDKAIKEARADGTIKRLSEQTFHMDVTPID
ncbi:transporter substrate-binding domain-containing protein [Pseudomonas sp. PD9R]|uniref:transporter substrate-binding domain-containing protein n=1 Tax=Pseudomonas sp. PD9R TaxID=2853534 RepID=UPI001C450179|nr:transporter substrate-binding domain-containing protein [Pseudomonas sp. PD9R]MBV6826501.1 transporter substrate-binding domain-containing protein [Pseudomonas sp. PD9R]